MFGNETMVPVLHCVSADETIAFYCALGFRVTYDMRRPYLYLALQWNSVEIHFGAAPKDLAPALENTGGCLVMVDDVAAYHAAFTTALRAVYGKVLATGRPRITRFRSGQSRFSMIDPSGNTIIVIQRDEPAELAYGSSSELEGLARAVDNARVFRDFKTDYVAAARILDTALRKHGASAAPIDLVRALAARAELAIMLNETERAQEIRKQIEAASLSNAQRALLIDELQAADQLEKWLVGRDI